MNAFPRSAKIALILGFALLLGGGALFYRVQVNSLEKQACAELEAIARLKVEQIASWRKERLSDASLLMESPFLRDALARWMKNPDASRTEEILARFRSLKQHQQLKDVLLVDVTGKVRLALSNHLDVLHEEALKAVSIALREVRPVLTDLHFAPHGADPHLDVIAPFFSGKEGSFQGIGAVVLQCDALEFLYPLIKSWPMPSRSAETLLVRRYGNDEVLYLNELRHRKETALSLRVPLSRTEMPAVMAVSGRKGVVRGRDYRGVDVLSALMAVPDSPWFVVAKIDADEALSVMRRESILILALLLGLSTAAAAVAAVFWQRMSKNYYRTLFEAEAARRKSEERYGATLLSVGDAVIVTDASGRVELLNPVAQILTGWGQEAASGRPMEEIFRIIDEDTGLPAENPVSRVLRNGLVATASHRMLVSRTGLKIPVEDTTAPIRSGAGDIAGVVTVFHDVTRQRNADNALRSSMEKLTLALEAADSGIWEWDVRTGENIWSEKLWKLYGLAPREGGPSYELWLKSIHPDDRAEAERLVIGTARSGTELKAEWRVLSPDGSVRWLMSRGRPLKDDHGLVVRYVGIVVDITERKRTEENISRARDKLEDSVAQRTRELQDAYDGLAREVGERERVEHQLRQAQKMDALGTLTGGIAHDFNNIVAAILGFSELAMEHAAQGSAEAKYLEKVFSAGLRGRDLIAQLLTFSRQQKQEKKSLMLSSIVKETMKLLRASIPSTIRIDTRVENNSAPIMGDPVQVQQVLMNLCTNAAYAMREKGGLLTVELNNFDLSVSSGGIREGIYVRLAVSDTGQGIPADLVDRIFDPFFTTKGPGEGTGLGLSIAHSIVRDHGGYITVETKEGEGSKFIVFFPQTQVKPSSGSEAAGPAPGGTERILVIDDEEPLALMVRDMLAGLGYDVVWKSSSREALALVRLDPARFDLVITDLTMPELTGLDLAREILLFRPDMPVIACTGFGRIVDEESAKAEGLKALIMKPLTKKELAGIVRRVLDGQPTVS